MEALARMEPTVVRVDSPERSRLQEKAWLLVQASTALSATLPAPVTTAVTNLVRSMNCYYSNLIEGHATLPVDIDRALHNDFRDEPEQRNLQLEARAHIEVQRWIDNGGLDAMGCGAAGICEIHRRFYDELPENLHWISNPETGERVRVAAGEFRTRDVKVGRHIPIAAESIDLFMRRWQEVYLPLGPSKLAVDAAAAHHRLVWIHPFMDGNGRVARLVTHAMIRKAMAGVGLWSVSRGFARAENAYKRGLAACDLPRQGDQDGRGLLSEKSLVQFTEYFLDTCLDQANYMMGLLRVDHFNRRLLEWMASQEPAIKKGGPLIEQLLLRGVLPRSALPEILHLPERTARRIAGDLSAQGLIEAETHRAPYKLSLPLNVAMDIFPGLIPANAR